MLSIAKIIFWSSASFLLYSYVLYPLLLALIGKACKESKYESENYYPNVSIIISAYNEESVIEKRIKNCLDLDYPREKLEIIIASDGSDDKTVDIAKKYVTRGIVLRDHKDRRGKVNVLNHTVENSKKEIIVFSDANALFKKDAISKLVFPFQDPKIGCVCGLLKYVSADGSDSGDLEGTYWEYETFLKKIEGAHGSLLGANGPIYAIRKKLFMPCPPNTIVEDFIIPMKILQKGYKVVYEPKAVAFEEAAKQISDERERRTRIGAGDYQALFRLLSMLNPRRGFAALAFFSHKVLRWLAPFFMIFTFVTNLFLLYNPAYCVLFFAQCVLYACGVVGRILHKRGIRHKAPLLCYYFVSMNLALFLGFIRYITGRQAVAWERTER